MHYMIGHKSKWPLEERKQYKKLKRLISKNEGLKDPIYVS